MQSDLDRAAAKLICAGFDNTEPSDEFLALLRRGISGVILFARNLRPPTPEPASSHMAALCARLKDAVDRPLLTSIDHDGSREGYDIELVRAVSESVTVPVIASGGAGEPGHIVEALQHGADAALVAGLVHDGVTTVGAIKSRMEAAGIPTRSWQGAP